MLDMPHMTPLAAYAEGLRAGRDASVPDFDPLDGGTGAALLFLLEKPGPRGRSGFISRDNGTGTSDAIRDFMAEAGIARERTALWNAVPWWNGTTAIRRGERTAGMVALAALLPLLPRLQTIVMVGRSAEQARPVLEGRGLALFTSAHPSPQVRAGWPERWRAIPAEWRRAASDVVVIHGDMPAGGVGLAG